MVAFVDRDGVAHAIFADHTRAPYLQHMMEHKTNVWGLCMAHFDGLVLRRAAPLTCLKCWMMAQHYGFAWHPMVWP